MFGPMQKHTLKAVTLLSIIISGSALGWGQTGHRITGAIATHYLTANAKVAIKEIIGHETLAQASTWPDEMRSDPSTFWQRTSGPWHYVTVPKAHTYAQVGAPKQGDAVTALKKFSADLKSEKTTHEQKQLALRFIVHIIGDLHQPLHAGNGTDRGGNDKKVTFFWEESNLHRVWDSGMIDREQLSYSEMTEWLLADISDSDINDWNHTDPRVWIAESTKLRDKIYPKSKELSWVYKHQNMPEVKRRLKMGGVRIAHYLNELFK